MVATNTTIVAQRKVFSHEEADRVSRFAASRMTARQVVLDLSGVADTTTSAFARLVLLRRTLLRAGRDLRLAGLHDQPACLYAVNRLAAVLPQL